MQTELSANQGRERLLSSRDCIFCKLDQLNLSGENEHAYAVRDRFPIKPLHTMIIPKRHIQDIFESNAEEREAIHELAIF
jgi:diadenosine tetraphosphate (Ap4A) HIT family hydrolase